MREPNLMATSPSGDTIKVFVDGGIVSLFMISADGMRARGCDTRPAEDIDDDLIALRLGLGLDTPTHMLAVPDRKQGSSR